MYFTISVPFEVGTNSGSWARRPTRVILLNARAGVAEKARVLVGRRRRDREEKEESGRVMNDIFFG